MAKVILQIRDRPGGQISFRLTSHPEAGPDPADFTPAQKMGLALITHMSHLKPTKVQKEPDPAQEARSVAEDIYKKQQIIFFSEQLPSQVTKEQENEQAPSLAPGTPPSPGITLSQLEGSGY